MKINAIRFGTGNIEDSRFIYREFSVFYVHCIFIVNDKTVKYKCLKFLFKDTLQFCYKFTATTGAYPYHSQLEIKTQLYFKIMYLR
jgi:hypothetical protein